MNRASWLVALGLVGQVVSGCGPDKRPQEGCDGPSFNLVVRAEDGPLPADTRINVRYGSNQDGEPYALGEPARKQAVFCSEDTSVGGTSGNDVTEVEAMGGAGGATSNVAPAPSPGTDVLALRCRLYTQGPARLDVTATGYEPIDDRELSFDTEPHCKVSVEVTLTPLKPLPAD